MIYGIDEVGRGCWAGPLVVAAVALPAPIDGLADSKMLSRKRRAELRAEITRYNKVIIEFISATEVDQRGLGAAMDVGVQRLFSAISKQNYDTIIIDGNINYLEQYPRTEAVVRADSLVPECMAASIVAKEARDEYMQSIHLKHPAYGFASHVGYGTKQHAAAIETHGIIDEHRKSFKPIANYLKK